MAQEHLEESVLENEYPVYYGYLYVADNNVIRSPLSGSIRELKIELGVKEIKNCDIFGRNLQHLLF